VAPKRQRDDDDDEGSEKRRKPEFIVTINDKQCTIHGRPDWPTAASKIKLGSAEDRRHMVHYDEMLKEPIEHVVTNLLHLYPDQNAVAEMLLKEMARVKVTSIRGRDIVSVVKRLTKEINGAVDNLIPGCKYYNNAIEHVRGYLRNAQTELSKKKWDAGTPDNANMEGYKQIVKDALKLDWDTPINKARSEIHEMCLAIIEGCETPSDLWVCLNKLIGNVTYDLSQKADKRNTARTLQWQAMICRIRPFDHPQIQNMQAILNIADGAKREAEWKKNVELADHWDRLKKLATDQLKSLLCVLQKGPLQVGSM
jgi:hypothetical protein